MKKVRAFPSLRVGVVSLGCAKNLVDAELMLGALLKDGMEITNDPVQADAVILNTCAFINAAQEESVDAILESAELREAGNRGQALIVAGCLPQRFRDRLPKLLPEVDAFVGVDQVGKVAEIVQAAVRGRAEKVVTGPKSKVQSLKSKTGVPLQSATPLTREQATKAGVRNPRSPILDVTPRPTFILDFSTPRFRLTPRHFAYVKIAEGCNHPCSFCTIPRIRGSYRSRQQADIVAEAKVLLANGVKELNLISQDTTRYALDLRPHDIRGILAPAKFAAAGEGRAPSRPRKGADGTAPSNPQTNICTLLRELNALPGDFWIRLLYTHPAHWTDELIRTIAECPKVARYVDIPLQHIHENMLQRMRRETSRQYILDLIRKIRAGVPGIALRTTFIVGFPGETEACFRELLDFIRETKLERLGVFTFSQEEGTIAGRMTGQIPDSVKRRRRDLAMAAQHEIARKISKSFVGREIKVLVEGRANEEQLRQASILSWEHGLVRGGKARPLFVARGEADAPDIDGRVYVRVPQGKMPVGEFARVKVIGHADYDLIAEPV